MPALALTPNSNKVLVTGANGYVGTWVLKTLLDRGYNVRAVVRSESKVAEVKALFPEHAGQLEFALVANLVAEGAFDDAVKGVDGILHLASPLSQPSADPDEIIQPAVNGTVGVLKSALKNAKSLKRVVIISSIAAIISPRSEPTTFTEADWNDAAVENIEKAKAKRAAGEPSEIDPFDVYRASKTLAERAAWKFYDENKNSINWDLVSINPPFIYGLPLYAVDSPAKLGGTQGMWYRNVINNDSVKTRDALGPATSNMWIDVRDVSEALVRALEKEEAGGERIIVSAGSYLWQEWLDTANKLLSEVVPESTYPLQKGYPELTASEIVYPVTLETSKEKRILGLEYRSMYATTKDVLVGAGELGWI